MVPRRALARLGLRVEDIAQERVHEAEDLVRLPMQEARSARFVEEFEHRRRREPHRERQNGHPELDSRDGRHGDQAAELRPDAGHEHRDRGPHSPRQRQRVVASLLGVLEQGQEMDEKERVASGPVAQARGLALPVQVG
jgi:hypothetical protein